MLQKQLENEHIVVYVSNSLNHKHLFIHFWVTSGLKVFLYVGALIFVLWGISCSNNDNFSKTYICHVLHKTIKKSVNHLNQS